MAQDDLLKEATAFSQELTGARRFLHAHPGIGFDIAETLDFVEGELLRLGYAPERCGKAGVVALAGGGKPGKVFLLRADMDALPVREEAEVEYRAENGKMHACGHDMHTAMLLGAARLLKAHEQELEGAVKLMFQPAEETLAGALDMVRAGVLENPRVDAGLMVHVLAGLPFPAGTVIVATPGVSAPAADYFEIRVQGIGCHGSMPNMGVDPLTAAAHILIALQEISARELAVADRAVLTIGHMRAGDAPNVIPDTAVMGGGMRAYDEDTRALLKERITGIAEAVAAAFRAKAEVAFGDGCPALRNDPELVRATEGYMKELFGEKGALSAKELQAAGGAGKVSGSEDFAYVSGEIPAVMLAIAAGQPEKGYGAPQHHPKVRFDEAALPFGSAAYAYAAMRWLEDNK